VQLPVKVPRQMLAALKRLAAEEGARQGRPVGVSEVVRETLQARLRRKRTRRAVPLSEEEEDRLLARAAEEAYYDPANQERIPWEQIQAESEHLP